MKNEVVNGQLQRAKGTADLYVTTSRPHLPVEYTEKGKIDKVASTLVMTFSRWGEHLTVTRTPRSGQLRARWGWATAPRLRRGRRC